MRPEGITDRPAPPWERPGAFRRDCEPHRGPLVLSLGVAALYLSAYLAAAPLALQPALPWLPGRPLPAWCLPLFPLAGFLLSLAAWALARHDLALMRRGRMDPAGGRRFRPGGGAGVPG
jgi:hypothetical protein